MLVPNNVTPTPPFGLPGGGGPLPFLDANNLIEGYFLSNARINWDSGDGNWGIAFEVKNLLDKYYLTTKVNDAFPTANVFGSPGKPRTLALTVKRNF
jgi:iron complex outermembrane receptor protein